MDRPLICSNQYVQIAIPVEISESRAAAHLGIREAASQRAGHILESGTALVQEKVRRLRVPRFRTGFTECLDRYGRSPPADPAAVEVRIEEEAAKAQAAPRYPAHVRTRPPGPRISRRACAR